MREDRGKPIRVSSAVRCREHNKNVGGVPNSFHVMGLACDLVAVGDDEQEELIALARKHGAKGIGKYKSRNFVHVDIGGRGYIETAYWEK